MVYFGEDPDLSADQNQEIRCFKEKNMGLQKDLNALKSELDQVCLDIEKAQI